MTRAIGVGLGLLLLIPAQATPPAQQPTFRAVTDAVTVEVSVRERARPITGLTAASFEVLDNGVRQQVLNVSYDVLPIDVTVVLDVSLSVTGPMLERLSHAVRQLMADLGSNDRLKLITFNTRVSRVVEFTTDTSAVENAIRASTAGGGSSVWDALGVAVASASDPNRRQLVMAFTDGADSSSMLTPDRLIQVIERTNAAVSAVVPSRAFSMRAVPSSAAVLRRVTSESGGVYIPVVSVTENLTTTFQRVLNEFRSTYVVHFTPTGVDAGGFHVLTVTVPGKSGYTIKARRGYFR